jgi:hypothetical protein
MMKVIRETQKNVRNRGSSKASLRENLERNIRRKVDKKKYVQLAALVLGEYSSIKIRP